MRTVVYLFVVNLLEMLALPWHILVFLLRRDGVAKSIRGQLESQWHGRHGW